MRTIAIAFSAVVLAVAGCGAPAPRERGPARPAAEERSPALGAPRTLVGGYRFEVNDLSPKITGVNSPVGTKRLFNADLALIDHTGSPRPYLAEELPRLNTDSWKVFADGRMETTYQLKPNLTWHDGQPLSAEDFAFAWRAYRAPGLGIFRAAPEDQMESVAAPDARTVVITWVAPNPEAGTLVHGQLNPLPRHILQEAFAAAAEDPSAAEAISRHPYWTTEYVGAGPFRLERWEPGSSIEGAAFDGHALGRPKLDRVILRIIPDENAILTNILAGEVNYTTTLALRFEHAMVLRREWEGSSAAGTVLIDPTAGATIMVQFRPELQQTAALLDLRVRRALAHAIDRRAINEGMFENQGVMAEALVPPRMPYTAEAERAITKHPYDLQQVERLMAQAGFSKDRDGFFADGRGERLRTDLRVNSGTEWERAQAVLAAQWEAAGFEMQTSVLPRALTRDAEANHQFSGVGQRVVGGGEQMWNVLVADEIGSPANRWRGRNRSGWSDPELETLWQRYNTTLDRPERVQQIVQMAKIVSDHLPLFMMYYQVTVIAHVGTLHGPVPGTVHTLAHWNVHEWELKS